MGAAQEKNSKFSDACYVRMSRDSLERWNLDHTAAAADIAGGHTPAMICAGESVPPIMRIETPIHSSDARLPTRSDRRLTAVSALDSRDSSRAMKDEGRDAGHDGHVWRRGSAHDSDREPGRSAQRPGDATRHGDRHRPRHPPDHSVLSSPFHCHDLRVGGSLRSADSPRQIPFGRGR